jgi:DNA repair protein RecO (recombination protein O)
MQGSPRIGGTDVARYVTEAICISRAPFGETSQVVHWLTRDLGREACLIRGAYRAKNRYHGNEDLLNLSRVTLSTRKGGALALLQERKLLETFPGLRQRLDRFAAGALVVEIVRWSTPVGQKAPELFNLVKDTLYALDRCGRERDIILFTFLGGMLKMTGFEPVLTSCTACSRVPAQGARLYVSPRHGGIVCRNCRSDMKQGVTISAEAARLILAAPQVSPTAIVGFELSESMSTELWAFFELFLTYFLEKELKALAFARAAGSPSAKGC